MSRVLSNAHAEGFNYPGDNCRTVAGIQRKIIRWGKRHAVSRVLHAKDEKDTIAAWKQDFNRILQVFNVRSVGSAWYLLTAPLSDGVVDQ